MSYTVRVSKIEIAPTDVTVSLATLYEQTVEELDLVALIAVVNTTTKRKHRRKEKKA
mgnify:CR=1 FL=1